MSRLVWIWVAWVIATGQTPGPEEVRLLTRATIESVAEDGRSVVIKPREAVVIETGQDVVFSADGTPLASGHVATTQPGAATVTMDWVGVLPAPGFEATLIPRELGRIVRARLPFDGALWTHVREVLSEGHRCILEHGEGDGLKSGDRLLVLRQGMPIARVEVDRFVDGKAQGEVTKLIGNAEIKAGDAVRSEQSPAARKSGRLRSRVLRVTGEGDQVVWFPVDERDGAAVGDRWLVSGTDGPVGVIELREFRGPFAVASGLAALHRRPIRAGDWVKRRDPRDVAAGRVPLQIFRVEGDYVLINAGETDQMARDQSLTAYREGRAIARLTLSAVKIDFSGAKVEVPATATGPATTRPVTSRPAGPELEVGDEVYAQPPSTGRRRLGKLEWVEAGRVAALGLEPGAKPAIGDGVVLDMGELGIGMAIVLDAGAERATLFVPSVAAPAQASAGTAVYSIDE